MWTELAQHQSYLADERRLDAYRRALATVVGPESVVLDLGCGTGILGFLAAAAGARRVYAVDRGGILGLARDLAAANGLSDRVIFLRGRSRRVTLAEPADVVVCDQLDPLGILAGVCESLGDARRRHLRAPGVTIPGRIMLEVAPVRHDVRAREIAFWETAAPAGLRLAPARALAVNNPSFARVAAVDVLGPPVAGAPMDPSTAGDASMTVEGRTEIQGAGVLHGLGAWFRAELVPGLWMTNSPLDPGGIAREQSFLPLDRPCAVEPGDEVRVALRVEALAHTVSWRAEIRSARGEVTVSAQSSFRGLLWSREDFEVRRPGFRPALSAWQKARLALLALCDGERTLDQIQGQFLAQHAALFASRAEAEAFVKETVAQVCL